MSLKEYKLKIEDFGNEKIKYPDNLGKRSKLGGKPDWIQFENVIKCDCCKKEMTFIGQIDSIDYSDHYSKISLSNERYMFGDVGMIYIFFCFECLKSQSVFQCY